MKGATSRLAWTRWRAGFYTAGNFAIEKTETKYGPRWTLTLSTSPAWSSSKPTLHQAQAIAESIAHESTLLAFGAAAAPFIDLTAPHLWKGKR